MILSICIPTHDGRAGSLREAIESALGQIVEQREGEVEICVSDNGSRDRTAQLIAEYAARHPRVFVTRRFETNQGGQRNFIQAVEIGSGEHCWYLGSDDTLKEGAVEIVLGRIAEFNALPGFYVARERYDREMRTRLEEHPLDLPPEPERFRQYDDASALLADLAVYQNYMSSVVFRRDAWQAVVDADGFEKIASYRHYAHSYLWCRMTVIDPHWAWLPGSVVNQRMENDSFLALGGAKAVYMAEMVDDMRRQLRDTVGERSVAYHVTMRKMFALWWFHENAYAWKTGACHTAREDWLLLRTFTAAWRRIPRFWVMAMPVLLEPHFVCRARKTSRPAAWFGATWLGRALHALPRRIAAGTAPRTRLRQLMGLFGVENGWTRRYDAHRENALRLAAAVDARNGAAEADAG